jgi:hypothetical protein
MDKKENHFLVIAEYFVGATELKIPLVPLNPGIGHSK